MLTKAGNPQVTVRARTLEEGSGEPSVAKLIHSALCADFAEYLRQGGQRVAVECVTGQGGQVGGNAL